jgi:uncharacterized membrane protein
MKTTVLLLLFGIVLIPAAWVFEPEAGLLLGVGVFAIAGLCMGTRNAENSSEVQPKPLGPETHQTTAKMVVQ